MAECDAILESLRKEIQNLEELENSRPHNVSVMLSIRRIETVPRTKDVTDRYYDVVFVEKVDTSSDRGKRAIKAHKTMLSAVSPFFSKIFEGDWKESDQEEIPAPGDFQWDVFKAIISFLYGKQIAVKEDSLIEFYMAADYLQIDMIKKAIGFELLRNDSLLSDPITAVKLCKWSSGSMDNVYTSTITYFAKHIQVLLDGKFDFSSLPLEAVEDIAASEDVSVCEMTLLHFLNMWACATENEVSPIDMQNVFARVRYGTFTHTQLMSEAAKCKFYNKEKLEGMLCYEGDMESDFKQFCPRQRQKPFLLFYCPMKKHMATEVTATHADISMIYTGCSRIKFTIQWTKPDCSILERPDILVNISSCSSEKRGRNNFSTIFSIPCTRQAVIGPSRCRISADVYTVDCQSCEVELTPEGMVAQFEDGHTKHSFFHCAFPCLIKIRGSLFIGTLTLKTRSSLSC